MALPMDNIPLNNQTKPMVLMIMNAAHEDANLLILKHFAGYTNAAKAMLVDLDESTITLRWQSANLEPGQENASWDKQISYVDAEGKETTVSTVGDCRRVLVGMARTASEALGVPLELPPVAGAAAPLPATTGSGTFGGAGSDGPQGGAGVRTLYDGGKGGDQGNAMAQMMQMMMMKGGGKGGIVDMGKVNGKGGAGEQDSKVFAGEGNKLGGSSTETAAEASGVMDGEQLAQQLRELDLGKPTSRLRVRLLDRTTAELEVNCDFTIREVQATLEHHHSTSFGTKKTYKLMDVNGFPPKHLADPAATVEQLGLSKQGSCLECRAV